MVLWKGSYRVKPLVWTNSGGRAEPVNIGIPLVHVVFISLKRIYMTIFFKTGYRRDDVLTVSLR